VKFNLHTHSTYCDGSKEVEDMILGAIKYKYNIIGISSHGPLPFSSDWTMKKEKLNSYIKEVQDLKNKYKDKIKVLLGLELDYIVDYKMKYIDKKTFDSLDYWIGSVHFLGKSQSSGYWTVDYNLEELKQGIKESFGGDVEKAVCQYYNYIKDMIENYNPPILGHLDLIKKNNQGGILFNESHKWYRKSVLSLLDKIKISKTVVELNTGGKYRGYSESYYPSNWILKKINEKNIPVTISRDAHDIESLDYEYEESIDLLKKIGFDNIYYFNGKKWCELKI